MEGSGGETGGVLHPSDSFDLPSEGSVSFAKDTSQKSPDLSSFAHPSDAYSSTAEDAEAFDAAREFGNEDAPLSPRSLSLLSPTSLALLSPRSASPVSPRSESTDLPPGDAEGGQGDETPAHCDALPNLIICRICDQSFTIEMIEQHVVFCAKTATVRGVKDKLADDSVLSKVSEMIGERIESVAKDSVAGEILSEMKRLIEAEKASDWSRDRRALERIEYCIKKVGRLVKRNRKCAPPDPSIGPYGSLLIRIFMDRKEALQEHRRQAELRQSKIDLRDSRLDLRQSRMRSTSKFFGLENILESEISDDEDGDVAHELEQPRPVTIHDFEMVKPISSGAFGKVWLARKIKSGDLYAVKIIRKADMIRKNMQEHVTNERNVMEIAKNPFLVNFFYAFQSEHYVYLVMEFIQGGDCGSLLENVGYLDEDLARHYIAETVLALEYLHSQNIVHR